MVTLLRVLYVALFAVLTFAILSVLTEGPVRTEYVIISLCITLLIFLDPYVKDFPSR